MKVLYDSNIYIKSWHNPTFCSLLESLASDLHPVTYASSVVIAECLAGSKDRTARRLVSSVFRPFDKAGRVITPSHGQWRSAGELLSRMLVVHPELRSKLFALWNDLLIALSSLQIGATVVTLNRQDFELIRSHKRFSLLIL